MANLVLLDAHVVLGGRTLDDVSAVTLNIDVTLTDVSEFSAEWLVFASNKQKSWNAVVSMYQDFDATAIDAFLFPKLGELEPFTVRHRSGVISGNNPSYQGNVIPLSYPPFRNAVGEIATFDIVLRGTGPLLRVTS